MGCWNETCMLSRTPIFSGDIVYAGLVAMRADWDTVHPDGVFVPVAPLVKSRYDDYGSPECCSADDSVMALYQDLEIETVRDGKAHPVSLDLDSTGPDGMMEILFDRVRHDTAYLIDTKPLTGTSRLPVFPIMILGRFWDLAQSSVKNSDLYLDEAPSRDVSLQVRLPGKFAQYLREGRLDEKTVMIPHLKLQKFMDTCRASWGPTCGSGSQEGITPNMAKLAKAVVKYRNEVRDEWD